MSTKRTTAAVTTSFQTQVARLHKDWESVQSAYENLTEKQIRFAERIKSLWDQAKSLDKQQSGESHQNYIRQELQAIIQTDNASILSRWVKIGGQAPNLLPLACSLPAQRDALYEAAKAEEKKQGSLGKWIDKEQIGPESTVREVKALVSGKPKSATKARPAKRKQDSSHVVVELRFKKNYGEVAQILRSVIESNDVVQIKSQTAFSESLKEILGKDGYDKIAKKFA